MIGDIGDGIEVTAELSMKSVSSRLEIANFSRPEAKSFTSSMINFEKVSGTLSDSMSIVFSYVIETVKLMKGMSIVGQTWEVGSREETEKGFGMSESGVRRPLLGAGTGSGQFGSS